MAADNRVREAADGHAQARRQSGTGDCAGRRAPTVMATRAVASKQGTAHLMSGSP
jgi:hypothetical protein